MITDFLKLVHKIIIEYLQPGTKTNQSVKRKFKLNTATQPTLTFMIEK